MQRSRTGWAALTACVTLALAFSDTASGEDELYKPKVAGPSPEASEAARSIRLAPGMKLELFASEPLLANPVAFCIDERGRFFVAETFRLHSGVTDNRSHMNWLDADMASKSVADRVAMYKKFLSPEEFKGYQVEHERIRLIEDRRRRRQGRPRDRLRRWVQGRRRRHRRRPARPQRGGLLHLHPRPLAAQGQGRRRQGRGQGVAQHRLRRPRRLPGPRPPRPQARPRRPALLHHRRPGLERHDQGREAPLRPRLRLGPSL